MYKRKETKVESIANDLMMCRVWYYYWLLCVSTLIDWLIGVTETKPQQGGDNVTKSDQRKTNKWREMGVCFFSSSLSPSGRWWLQFAGWIPNGRRREMEGAFSRL